VARHSAGPLIRALNTQPALAREWAARKKECYMRKLVVCFAALAISVASAADTYRVKFFQESIVNQTALKPGDYKVTVENGKAVISSGKDRVEAEVKTESSEQKYSSTSVRYKNGDGKYRVSEIRLGGTKTKLVFDN
jgi:hypothetical protein